MKELTTKQLKAQEMFEEAIDALTESFDIEENDIPQATESRTKILEGTVRRLNQKQETLANKIIKLFNKGEGWTIEEADEDQIREDLGYSEEAWRKLYNLSFILGDGNWS